MTDSSDDAWFDALLQDVQATAPDDLRGAVRQMVDSEPQPVVPVGLEQRRLRWISVAAAAVAVSVAGLVMLLNRGESPSTLTGVSSAATELAPILDTPNPSTVPSTTAAQLTASTVAPSSVDVVPDSPIASSDGVLANLGLVPGAALSGDVAVAALARLEDHRVGLLRESSGFRGTSTFGGTWALADGSKPQPDAPPTVVDVTVLANGDAWAAYPNGDWFRFDAVAGVTWALTTNPIDGTRSAHRTDAAPVQHNYGRVFGHDPLGPLGGLDDAFRRFDDWSLQVSASEFEGGEAVEVRFESERIGPINYVVDLRTGLVVEFESTEVEEKGTLGGYSSITGLTDADALPIAELPQLPDGLEWQDFGFPEALAATIQEARAAFGSGLVLPQTALDAGFVSMEQNALTSDGRVLAADDPEGETRSVRIYHFEPVGLLRTTVQLSTERPSVEGTVPSGYVQIADRICLEPCRSTSPESSTMRAESGALAGIPFFGQGSGIATNVDGIFISIEGLTRNEAAAIADTFVTVGDDE